MKKAAHLEQVNEQKFLKNDVFDQALACFSVAYANQNETDRVGFCPDERITHMRGEGRVSSENARRREQRTKGSGVAILFPPRHPTRSNFLTEANEDNGGSY
jgi:hypothetical protein